MDYYSDLSFIEIYYLLFDCAIDIFYASKLIPLTYLSLNIFFDFNN